MMGETVFSGASGIDGRHNASGVAAQAWLEMRGWAPPGFGQSYAEVADEFEIPLPLLVGQMAKETGSGTSAIFRDKKNPAGLAAENDDPYNKAKGFNTWKDGQRAHAAHLRNYFNGDGWWNAVYPDRIHLLKSLGYYGNARDLNYLSGRWAFPGQGYGESVAHFANVFAEFAATFDGQGSAPPTGRPAGEVKVMLVPGHFNTGGGNPVEKVYINRVFKPIHDELKRRGFDVRTIQGFNADGTIREYTAGDHNAVAREAVRLRSSWPWNLYLEVHFEGVGNTSVRGAFGIYPHNVNRGDLDTDVRDQLAPDMAKRISDYAKMPLRMLAPPGGPGVMSETQTGVRELGVFINTSSVRAQAERMLIEAGTFTSPQDRAIMDRADFPALLARAVSESVGAFYRVDELKPEVPTPSDPDEIQFMVPGYGLQVIRGGMAAYWKKWDAILRQGGLNSILEYGLPLSGEYDREGLTVQDFERARLEWHKGADPANFDILRGRVNAELLERISQG